MLVVALLGGIGAWFYTRNLNEDLARTDPFSEITGGRPAKAVDGALNILLVGRDSRDPDAAVDKPGEWRADTLIVMHIPADHQKAYLVSIPRDLYVPIPENARRGLRLRSAREDQCGVRLRWPAAGGAAPWSASPTSGSTT